MAAVVPTGLLTALVAMAPPVLAGDTLRVSVDWLPALGIRYALALDGLALLFAGLVAATGVLILIYSVGYMPRGPGLGRFYACLLLFAGAMLGVVLADDLVVLYIFWELTSLASFFLIGYDDERPEARAGATQALVVTIAGGVAMLAGLVLLAQAGGSWQISELRGRGTALAADARYAPIVLLVLAGALTKSAQIPFQFWLPGAMVAPTPVSTYLHSATMVWAGVYLLARLVPVLGGTALWTGAIVPVGLGTLVLGAAMAIVQTDLKALLAYATVGALGLATALVGIGTPAALGAAMAHIVAHAAYKGALFLVAGAVEHETGTRQTDRLAALGGAMPVTAAVAGAATLSMAALPPFVGFLTKEAALDAALARSWVAFGAVALSGACTVAYGARFARIFYGRPPAVPEHRRRGRAAAHAAAVHDPHEPPALLWAPPAVLAATGLALGVLPGPLEALAGPAASAAAGLPQALHLWHGPTPQAALVTAAALATGGALFAGWPHGRRILERTGWLSTGKLYDLAYASTLRGARALTAAYMTGRLRDYLIYVMVAGLGLLVAGLARTGLGVPIDLAGLAPAETLTVLVAIAASLAAIRLRLLVGAILALGVAGYSVSLIYLFLSAPDIALTQVVIETVSLVLFVVALTDLGRLDAGAAPRRAAAEGATVLAAGAVVAALALMVAHIADVPRVAASFFANAERAGGTNVVNLVIVDFRGWDTMGEISVLAIAALGIMALTSSGRAVRAGRARTEAPMTSVILQTVARVAAPLIVFLALRMWATGHYGPGGGFVAGLLVAGAVTLLALAFGPDRLARRWDVVMAAGLLLAVGSGAAPLLVGAPPLQHTLVYAGPVKLASSLVFDFGVLLLVAGTVLAAVRALVGA
jgi:NADH:ubiquinone oxidoreductase subunit 5 (subunit L)/multisubunit Na+/H+ antiporter MnhA subunit